MLICYVEKDKTAERSWVGDSARVLFALSVVFRIISMLTKRAFLEALKKGNDNYMRLYFVGEMAAVVAIVVTTRAQQRPTFNRSFWLQILTAITLISDAGSAAFSGGSGHQDIDNAGKASIFFKACVDALKMVTPCVAL